ncbi:molecular chaperone HtpG [bacterium]|nr:molecular chaperone HtpG [bacterium]
MSKITGEISIHTQNIFPIIKKWLYSEHEIFARELISNAFDAITKRNTIATRESKPNLAVAGAIHITLDKAAKTLTFSDNGIGMDAEDIQKYINQIAFSGAEEFVKKYQDQTENEGIIGHFGLGFYSSFMVASRVEIHSKSYRDGTTSARWECDGSTSFSITDGTRDEIGTDVILHISDENEEYLFDGRLEELVKKYANFLPVDILVNGKSTNVQNPLWTKAPTDVADDDYKSFYQTLFPYSPDPLFWIHLNVDYPFNLRGILYFPKRLHEMDGQKGQVKLFCQQVFVSDSAKEVLPEFLTILQGAIDCPQLPLNVSRSFLQNDPYVQKISKHVVKKVADKLVEEFRVDRERFAGYWDDIQLFVKFGMIQHPEFYDKSKDVILLKTTDNRHLTVGEYTATVDGTEKKIIYTSNPDSQAQYIQLLTDRGMSVIVLSTALDSHFIQFLESKETDLKFVSVESFLADETGQSEVDNAVYEQLFRTALDNEKLVVKVQALSDPGLPAIVTQPEFLKRLQEMSVAMGTRGQETSKLWDEYTLVLNSTNEIVQSLGVLNDQSESGELRHDIARHIYDLALMGHRPLSGQQMSDFINRSTALLTKIIPS